MIVLDNDWKWKHIINMKWFPNKIQHAGVKDWLDCSEGKWLEDDICDIARFVNNQQLKCS